MNTMKKMIESTTTVPMHSRCIYSDLTSVVTVPAVSSPTNSVSGITFEFLPMKSSLRTLGEFMVVYRIISQTIFTRKELSVWMMVSGRKNTKK